MRFSIRPRWLLLLLLVGLQWPLWFGKGGWFKVWELDRQLAQTRESNRKLAERNGALEAEVRDLKQGQEAIEERARAELGMIRQDEVFYQVVPGTTGTAPKSPAGLPVR